jgi:hypothetical protein
MGCLVDAGILNPDKTLSQNAKDNFIKEVKEIIIYGSANTPTPSLFGCGDEIPPTPGATFENIKLEDETIYGSFHRDILKNKYEKFAAALDVESTHSLLPLIADPLALAGKLGVDLPAPSFPDGFIPYFSGLLIPKLSLDLFDAGIPDYLFPPALAAKLPDFISIPQPPALFPLPAALPPPIPGVTPPPLPEVTPPEFPDIPQLSDLAIPQIPTPPVELALGELLSVDVAIVKTIPKLLGGIIADIPKLVLKLTDLPSLFSDICKKVSESGMFGEEKENEKLKKIYNRVLSKKLSSCLFTAALASTIGSGKGSVSSAVSEKATNVPAPPAPPPTQTPVPSWQDRIKSKADTCSGLSYGRDKRNYVEILYYVEHVNSISPSNNVSTYGKPVIPGKLPDKSRFSHQEDLIAAFSANTIKREDGSSYSGSPQEFGEANQYGVEDSYGFLKYAEEAAKNDSSCAIFARSCLYSAGSKNEYMLSHYPPGAAMAAIECLATLKNYDWLVKSESGSSLVANEELFSYASSIPPSTTVAGLIGGWTLKEDFKPVNQNKILIKYAKKKEEELACLSLYQLKSMAKSSGELPPLETGDILIMKSKPGGKFDDTHAAVVYQVTDQRIKFKKRPDIKDKNFTLSSDIVVIEGGLEDPGNRGKVSGQNNPLGTKQEFDAWEKAAKAAKAAPNDVGKKNALKEDYANKLYQTDDTTVQKISPDGTSSDDVSELVTRPLPTRIERGRFNEGYIDDGFWIRKSGGNKIGGDGDFRRIEMIIKTRNFLSIELFEKDNPDSRDACSLALAMQDLNPAMIRIIGSLKDSKRLAVLLPCLYPSWPRRKKFDE